MITMIVVVTYYEIGNNIIGSYDLGLPQHW